MKVSMYVQIHRYVLYHSKETTTTCSLTRTVNLRLKLPMVIFKKVLKIEFNLMTKDKNK